jgi:acyl-CoA thioester hydrolase
VLPEWVDYNGHLRDAYYLLIFSYATDALMDLIGLDSDGRGQSGHSLFTLEAHINYLHEVKLDTEVWVQTQIIGFDSKRLHLYHSLHRNGFDAAVSASEQMLLHVDLSGPRSTPFSEHSSTLLREFERQQRDLPPPALAGRTMHLPS